MFCSHCGANAADSAFCSSCGARMPRQDPAGQPLHAPVPSQQQPSGGPPKQSKTAVVLVGVLVGVLVLVALGVGAVVLINRDSGPSASLADSTSSTTAATPTPKAPAPAKKKPKSQASARGDVRALAAGLFCRDLQARGYSYVAAIDYWRVHGQPNQMDADRNGIPCETVYPPTDVSSYWSERELPQAASAGSDFLPSGLFCRDLNARDVSYADAVAYWWEEGAPDRMDAERNGIPCETVYPDYEINGYW